VGLRSEFGYRSDRLRSEAEGAYRPGDILYLLLAKIIERDRQLVADLIAHRSGDA
jgi:hypothetical protein